MNEFFISMAAAAQSMTEHRTPFSYDWLTYVWVIGVGLAGGWVSFIQKLRSGAVRPFNIIELIGELVTSGFVAVLTFWLCEWANVDKMLSAVFMGITAHMGSRVLFVAEKYFERYLDRRMGIELPREDQK